MNAYNDERPAIYVWKTAQALQIPTLDLIHMIKEPANFDIHSTLLEDAHDYMRVVIAAVAPTPQERYWLGVWVARFVRQPDVYARAEAHALKPGAKTQGHLDSIYRTPGYDGPEGTEWPRKS